MKNHLMGGWAALLILSGLGIMSSGCPGKNSPTSPGPTTVVIVTTSTAISTPTGTLTPFTPTASFTASYTTTNSPTLTASTTPTVTGIATSTKTATDTPSYTATDSPMATASNTETPTNIGTSTVTGTPSFTPSDSPTALNTFTPTNTPTVTVSFTSTNSPTAEITFTFTASFTETQTGTATLSPTYTPTPTPSNSPSSTTTFTITSTFTLTSTATDTPYPGQYMTETAEATITPATFTATSTSTQTETSTPTNFGGSTSTFTLSPTNTPYPGEYMTETAQATITPSTSTPSFTPTLTETSTATNFGGLTSTPTLSPTVTSILVATNTPAPCSSAVLLSNYTFDYGLQCWQTADSALNGVVASYTTSTVHSGLGAFEATAPFSGTNTVNIDILFASPVNLTGQTISLWVYVDAPVIAGTGNFAQLFTQSGSGYTWENSSGTALSAGSWIQLTFTPTWATSGENSMQVERLGVQIGSGTSATTGHIYVDDVVIENTPGTPTPVPGETWFDSTSTTSLTGWSDYSSYYLNGVTSGATPVVSGVSSYSPGYNSANCVTDNIQFIAAGQQDSVQYTWGTGNNDGANFTSLGVSGIRGWVETSAVFAGGAGSYPGADAFVNSGNYAGNENGGYANLPGASTWTQVNFPFTWSNSGENASNVQQVGFSFYTGSTATSPFNTANVYVSNVELY